MPERAKKWDILYNYEAEIFGYIKNAVGNSDVARDLFQDVFLQALKNLDQLDPDRSLKNWLKKVAHNRVVNYYREHKRRQYEELSESLLTTEVESDEIKLLINRALDGLPARQKEIIRLREIEGQSYHQIGKDLSISESAVTSLLSRARQSLKQSVLLQILPSWFVRQSSDFNLDDLGRFINAFDHAENLFRTVESRSQDYFHHIREEWNKWQKLFIRDKHIEQLEKLLGDQKNKLLLDLGCGTGLLANRFRKLGANVVAVDLNRSMLESLRVTSSSMEQNPLSMLQANVQILPVKENTFDQVFFMLVLHHVADPAKSIGEAYRVLNKNGRMVIIDFIRHRNHELADHMRDLWLGFNPKTVIKWCKTNKLILEKESTWNSGHQIDVFMQVYKKLK